MSENKYQDPTTFEPAETSVGAGGVVLPDPEASHGPTAYVGPEDGVDMSHDHTAAEQAAVADPNRALGNLVLEGSESSSLNPARHQGEVVTTEQVGLPGHTARPGQGEGIVFTPPPQSDGESVPAATSQPMSDAQPVPANPLGANADWWKNGPGGTRA